MAHTKKRIAQAFWEADGSCIIMLTSDWPEANGLPPLSLQSAGSAIGSFERPGLEECGRYCGYYRDEEDWVFTLDAAAVHPQLSERVFLAADFNNWAAAIGKPEWELLPKDRAGTKIYSLSISVGMISRSESAQFKFVTDSGKWLDVPANALNRVQAAEGIVNYKVDPQQTGFHIFRLRLPAEYKPLGNETLLWKEGSYEERYDLSNLQTLLLAATDLPLGAIVAGGQTTFRLFVPRATGVQLAYGYEVDSSDAKLVAMQCSDGLTWEVVLPEDLSGAYYSFRVSGENRDGTTNFDASFAILDPYAKACFGNYGPGIVVDPKRLKRAQKPFEPPALQDLVILEGHVRDLAVNAPIELTAAEREGFTGLRKWAQAKGSYFRELGVNAIELQPVQQIGDIVNKGYHWGYMPANYFSPASNYAMDPGSASQIEEFRDLVQAFHDQGMAVIVDVVYNHIGEPYHLSYMDTYYFLRLDADNKRTNWSGCGNDFRCDTPMARRLIIESLTHFVEVYDVDGFRFDLAELIGIEVLREIEVELKKIKPSLILIAEPWSFRGHIQNALKSTGYASWNDGFRESIAHYVRGEGTAEMIRYYVSGSPGSSRFAAQTINYTESHDDHCWIDRITENPDHDGSNPTWLDQRRTHLMVSILLVSLGVPMLSEGQDFMLSKFGIANTYQRGDVNALDYRRRQVYSGTQNYIRDWVYFRLSNAGRALRYEGPLKEGYLKFFATEGSSAVVAVFNADRSIATPPLIFAVNPHPESVIIDVDAGVFAGALQIADHERFNANGLPSVLIKVAEGPTELPPHSCALWQVQ